MKKFIKPQDVIAELTMAKSLKGELFLLIFKGYRRTFQYIFFGFIQPVFIFAIFYFVFTSVLHKAPESVIPGYILLAPISTAFLAFGGMMSTWKESIFLKRIQITPISHLQFLATFVGFYFSMAVLSAGWMLGWASFFLAVNPIAGHSIHAVFAKLNWGWLILSLAELILICNCIAIAVAGLSSSANNTDTICTAIFFPSAFLSGIMVPNAQVDQYKVLEGISFVFPFKYPAYLSDRAWGAHIDVSVINNNIWIPIVVGFSCAFLFFSLALKTFKWTSSS